MSDVFYNKTVTVYNKVISDADIMGNETWYAKVLSDVRILTAHRRNAGTGGLSDADTVRMHIKTDNLSVPYKKPVEWGALEDKSTAFTLQPGEDFFVVGDTSSEDTTVDNFYEYMRASYDDCFKVTNVDEFELIPHLEVGGA